MDVKVTPAMAMAPANVRVRVTLPPSASNRVLAVAAESEDFFRASEVPLEGERAPRTFYLEYRSLPPGTYEFRSAVVDSHGQQLAVASTDVIVMGMDGK